MTSFFSRKNPFLASLKERKVLSKPGSKEVYHFVIDLKGSNITYQVGDSLGIYPRHDAKLVAKTLHALRMSGNEKVTLMQTGEETTLSDCLSQKCNITTVSPKLFQAVCKKQSNSHKKQLLTQLSTPQEQKEFFEKYEIWDFLLEHSEVAFAPQEIVDLLQPLLPRFYSISSSQKIVGEEIHLTVAPVVYISNDQTRNGVCTHFLCSLIQPNQPGIPIFIQPTKNFQLPEDHARSLIMIGPGTGIAPFRAFLQERILHHRTSGKHWLFFGEWHRHHHFLYEEEWQAFSKLGHLQLDLAFSRDQTEKIYVQNKMREQGKELYSWLQKGASIYVCGDAKKMAKDVDLALHDIIEEHGQKDPETAREYVKRLRMHKRYLRDIY